MALRLKDTLAQLFRPPATPRPAEPRRERRSEQRRPDHQTVLVEWEDLEKGHQAFAGRLVNRSERGMGIRGPRLLPLGKTVSVSPAEEPTVRAVVRHCEARNDGFFLGMELIPREKRRTDREPMYCAARISCTRGGRRNDLPVIIRDASETGVQLESHEPLTADEIIEISHLGSYREGTVTHCQRDDDGYRIGVQFIGPALPEASRDIN